MQNDTAVPAATMDELATQVAKLRARIDAWELLERLSLLGELPRPKLCVITSTGRRRTARRGQLALVGGAR
jgi:hypothetical protein